MIRSILCICIIVFNTTAQKPSQVTVLKKQLIDCRNEFALQSKVVEDNSVYQKQLLNRINVFTDSVKAKDSRINTLVADKKQNLSVISTTQGQLQQTNSQLSEALKVNQTLDYELMIANSPNKKMYLQNVESLKSQFLKSLNEPKNGFTFDETADGFKVTKAFGENTEAWWIFDKTIDTILELHLSFEPHKFDNKKSILTSQVKLLEKVRFSNKQYEAQSDEDKINLYKTKCIKILEGK